MKLEHSQIQTRFFISLALKTLSLFASILILGSFTTSHAKLQNQSINTTITFVCSTGPVASYDEFATVQIKIGDQPIRSKLESVPSGAQNLTVIPQPPSGEGRSWIVKEIRFDGKPVAAPNTPQATVPITITYTGPGAAVPTLEITVDQCGAAAASQRLPIIFLPGVAGSRLYGGEGGSIAELWPASPATDRAELALEEDGKTQLRTLPNPRGVILGDALRSAPGNFYGDFIESLKQIGYKEYNYRVTEAENRDADL